MKIHNLFSRKSKERGIAPLTQADTALLMTYLLKTDGQNWFKFRHGDKSDVDLIYDMVNNFSVVLIDQFEADEYILSKARLEYGWNRAHTQITISKECKIIDINKLNEIQMANLALQYAVLDSAIYTTNMPIIEN